ncbi:hypothetical protein ACJJJB_00180 (plasmid) [Microbulbifer sp. ANSA001]|uniref:hypothetical protein n=1 Tax=Microbulbifer sp. ANSA001 TaxID=3243358 RepID=UPI0040433FEF
MPLFESPEQAWHDAFTTVEGFQDPYSPRPPKGTAPSSYRAVLEGELAKVRKVIKSLPEALRDSGMWAFGPDGSDVTRKSRDKMNQRVWEFLLDQGPENAYRRFEKNCRMTVLITAISEQVRSEANDARGSSEAIIAAHMGINRSTFSRVWAPVYRGALDAFKGEAKAALTGIDPLIQEINRRYRSVG